MTDVYQLGDWMIYFVETVLIPLFCEIMYLVCAWTTITVYALLFTATNKPRRAEYAVFTCIMYDVECVILDTIINKNQSITGYSDAISLEYFLCGIPLLLAFATTNRFQIIIFGGARHQGTDIPMCFLPISSVSNEILNSIHLSKG